MRNFLVTLLCLVLLTNCATPVYAPVVADQGPYRLDTGDSLRIIVYGQEEISTDYIVSDNGTISFPLLGELPVRGRTVAEFQQQLAEKLNAGVLRDAGLSVQLSKYRPFSIVGEVKNPGQYAFAPGLNLIGAIAMAGGYTERASLDRATIVRVQDGKSGEWSAQRLTNIQPGDVIIVRERFF